MIENCRRARVVRSPSARSMVAAGAVLGALLCSLAQCGTGGDVQAPGADTPREGDGVDAGAGADARAAADAVPSPDATDPADATSAPARPSVVTFRNDNARTGAYLGETELDVATVRARGMRLAFTDPVAGEMNAQPLYVSGLDVNGKSRDVVFAATLANNLYAFDAREAAAGQAGASSKLWEVHFTDPDDAAARPLSRGIYSTPVIDLATSTMYVVFSTRNTLTDHGKLTPAQTAALDIAFYVAAIDIRTGATLRATRLSGSYPKKDGTPLEFDARNHWCRPGLLLDGGALYVACGMRAHELTTTFHGWVFRYDPASLARKGTFCTSPDVNVPSEGAGIWQSGSGLAADPDGNVYFITGNGAADFASRTYGDSMVKLSTKGGGLSFEAAFTPEGPDHKLDENDVDFGSGGALVLPGTDHVLGGGKTGIFYLLGRGSLDKVQEFQAAVNQYDPTAPVDSDWEGGPHLHGTPAFWRAPSGGFAYVYAWGEQDYLRAYRYDLATGRFDASRPLMGKVMGLQKTMPGGTLSVSSSGAKAGSGIVWATLPRYLDPDSNPGGRLFAYDAETLDLLWETTFPSLPKWMPPTIVDGRVFVGTTSDQLLIYELGVKP